LSLDNAHPPNDIRLSNNTLLTVLVLCGINLLNFYDRQAPGALVEPMSVAFDGVLRSEIEPRQTGLIFSAGPIGIGALLGLRTIGVERSSPLRHRMETLVDLCSRERGAA